jgi:hypothetical protein
MYTTGRHCERTKDGPKMFPLSKRPGYTKKHKKRRKHMPAQQKPVKEWLIVKQPKLATFLDEDVRKAVEARWQHVLDHDGKPPTRVFKSRGLPPKSR